MAAGIYLHIPFCKSRCSYCDFATDVYRSADSVERYVNALIREIAGKVRTASVRGRNDLNDSAASGDERQLHARAGGSDIDTIYFGGGTPSLLAPNQVKRILDA